MTDPVQPLIVLASAEDAQLCGPDGCTIPTDQPSTTVQEEKSTTA